MRFDTPLEDNSLSLEEAQQEIQAAEPDPMIKYLEGVNDEVDFSVNNSPKLFERLAQFFSRWKRK